MRSEDTDQNNSYVISNCAICQILNQKEFRMIIFKSPLLAKSAQDNLRLFDVFGDT